MTPLMAKAHRNRQDPFPPTDWSNVRMLNDPAGDRRQALEQFLLLYRPAFYRYLRSRGLTHERAEDIAHDFIADRILRADILARADAGRGKLRAFLVTALRNYAVSQLRRRDGDRAVSDDLLRHWAGPDRKPDVFDRQWAVTVFGQAIERARACFDDPGQAPIWALFEARVLRPLLDRVEVEPYERFISEGRFRDVQHATNALTTAKRAFRRALRSVVREYATDPAETELEVSELRLILERTGN